VNRRRARRCTTQPSCFFDDEETNVSGRSLFIVLLAIVAVLALCGMSYADSAVVQYSRNRHLYQRFDLPPPKSIQMVN
jgi:hypothetical protein